MRYMGSKARLAKHILPIMLKERGNRLWVEPFVGGGNLIQFVSGRRYGSDINKYAIAVLDAASKGWIPNKTYTEAQYELARSMYRSGDTEYLCEVGYLGFAGSFGGKFFGGFARSVNRYGEDRDHLAEQYRYCKNQFPLLKDVTFETKDYSELQFTEPCLIYCDPPYAGTTKYVTDGLNYEQFYAWCCTKVDEGHTVFVSEYLIDHPRFKEVWTKDIPSSIRNNSRELKPETLYKIT